jgi:hypothetical protein
MGLRKPLHSTTAVFLALLLPASSITAAPESKRVSTPYRISLSPAFGEVTRSYPTSDVSKRYPTLDFIIIQDAHGSQQVQRSISHILKQLQTQHLLPERIAVEGAMGPLDVSGLQRIPDRSLRKRTADELVAMGQMTGSMHFVVSQGRGGLYGLENNRLYDTSVEMFRRSFRARLQLSRKLAQLEAALAILIREPDMSAKASILAQDVQVIRRLIDQRLMPTEIQQVLHQAVFAIDHLKTILPEKTRTELLEPVAAAVDFYVLAFLRDDAFFKQALDLREEDQQKTTVIVAGGFHTPGLVQRLRIRRFSYVVITPRVKTSNQAEQRAYVERLLGYRLVGRAGIAHTNAVATAPLLTPELTPMNETWATRRLADTLRRKLATTRFSIPNIRDIFSATNRSWIHPSVKIELARERSRILAPTLTSARKN